MDATLESLLKPGDLVWLSDGVGTPTNIAIDLCEAARAVGDIRLALGWCPCSMDGFDFAAFAEVRTIMGGYGLRRVIDNGTVRYVPTKLSAVPALLARPMAPDLVIVAVRSERNGFGYGPEVGWLPSAVGSAKNVAVIINDSFPSASSERLTGRELAVIGETSHEATEVALPTISEDHLRVGEAIASLIPAASHVQFGPGPIGAAALLQLSVPVHIETGIINDSVAELDARNLVIGKPMGTYLAGTGDLYTWANGKDLLHRVEVTHSPGRIEGNPPLVAINTAIEMDVHGQVNVERIAGSTVGGIGGHPDFAAAAARQPDGISVIAMLTHHNGVPTLVEELDAPVTTPRHDVDIVATERGVLDLRGMDDAERRVGLSRLWGF